MDEFLGEDVRKQITDNGVQKGFYVVVRNKEYAEKKSEAGMLSTF